MFPNWAKNILFLLVFMISGLVLAIIIEGLLSGNELIPLNVAIEQVITRTRTPFLTNFFVAATKLGSPSVLLSLSAAVVVFLALKRRYYDAALFATAMGLAIISLTVLKETFQIVRPGSDITEADGWSFPSGHATVAVAFFFVLILTFFGRMKTALQKTGLIAGSIAAALIICLSRLYLGAHWTLDILAGFALGLLSVSFTVLIFGIFLDNRRSLRNVIE